MHESRLRPRRPPTPRKGKNITLYVVDENRDVWDAADRFVEERGVSLSSVVADALARYLADPPKPEER